MSNQISRFALTFLVLCWAATTNAAELLGKVVRVSDGDTITILDAEKNQHRIRLLGIDAPESKQAFGEVSRKHLADLVAGKDVRISWREKDRYGRILGDVFVGETWANREMVTAGLSWHYKKYDSRKELAEAEVAAREKKLGLWIEKNPIPPWEWRQQSTTSR